MPQARLQKSHDSKPRRRRWAAGLIGIAIVGIVMMALLFCTPQGRHIVRHIPILNRVALHFLDRPVMPKADAFGIDISRYQGDIDWEKLGVIPYGASLRKQSLYATSSAPIAFIFAKATEGADYVDPNAPKNLPAIRKRGIPCGAYHVMTLANTAKQARNFINNAKLRRGDLVPVIDIEDQIFGTKPVEQVIDSLTNLSRHLRRKYNRHPIIYSSVNLAEKLRLRAKLPNSPLWIARYNATMRPEGADIWQFSDIGLVPGIDAPVDLNAFYASRYKLSSLTIK